MNKNLKLDEDIIENWDEMKRSYLERLNQFGFCPKTLFYSKEQLHLDRLTQVSILLKEYVKENKITIPPPIPKHPNL